MKLELKKKDKAPAIILSGPSIVDLTPPRSRETREKRELTRKWIAYTIATAVVVFASIAGGFAFGLISKASYDNEVEKQASLTKEIGKYKDVNDVVNSSSDLENKRSLALGGEINWTETLARVRAALPDGVRLTGYSAAAGGLPTVDVGVSVALVVQIASDEPIDYTAVEDAFRAVPSIKQVIIGGLQAEQTTTPGENEGDDETSVRTYKYPVAIGFDNSVFTGRWLPEEAKKQLEEVKKAQEEAAN